MWRGLLTGDRDSAHVAVFGIASDANCSIGRGAGEAPRVMRECSEFLPPATAGGTPLTPCMWDLGDVNGYCYDEVLAKHTACADKPFTLVLGGDHSVSILSQKAYRSLHWGRIGIIHVDAHADICDSYQNSTQSHACVNRRALENGYDQQDIAMVGIRSYELQEVEFLKDAAVKVYDADAVRGLGAAAVVAELTEKFKGYDRIYLSFDIDAVDPAYAPGTGTPEHFGLTSLEVRTLLTGIVRSLPVTVMDVVEVAPPLDQNNVTTWLALKYILEILNIIDQKEKQHG
ncbi:MAG: arginase family protein [Clostridia bacterium]|nr:arginase family protein [Clostridia bacterium]